MPVSAELLKKLAEIDTPTICNVIELFYVVPRNQGYMDARIKCQYPDLPPMVGYAVTACFRADAPPSGGDVYGGMDKQVELFANNPQAVLVFQDLDDPPVAATFGEVMCSTYKAFGSAGLITTGAGRDLAQVAPLKYPVFTSGTICSHGYCHMLNIGFPVRVGGMTVRTGDLLHGDANGVASIPEAIASEIVDITPEFVNSEKIVLDYVNGPGPKTAAGLRECRKEFAAVVNTLIERVRRDKK